MAANPFELSNLGPNFFDIYTDGVVTPHQKPPGLPNGGCNFVDLTPGANGSKCGCRRFWVRQSLGSPAPDQAGWCMCNHHACFHDHDHGHLGVTGAAQPVLPVNTNPAGQENEKPRIGREPLSPMEDVHMRAPSAVPGLDFPSFSAGAPLSFVQDLAREPETYTVADGSPRRPQGSMPDTLAWGDCVKSQPGPSILPPIPSQCIMPSQTASTTSSAQAKYLRPFAGKGLGTLDGTAGAFRNQTSQQPCKEANPRGASFQIANHPENSFVLVGGDANDPGTPRPDTAATQAEPRVAAAFNQGIPPETFQNLFDTVSGHEQRMDRLEAGSFSAAAHEECQEKHEHLDLRVTELEQRMDGVERTADNASVIHRGDPDDDITSRSVVSASTSATTRGIHSQDMMSHLHSLQLQVSQLQSFLPSHSHSWAVEVVFLPFPLKRLWQDISLFSNDAAISNDDWTQLPMTHSTTTLRSQSPYGGEWTTISHGAEWLLPKACSDNSTQDRRLRSRGLIQTVYFKGPDSRSVQSAIHTAFGSVFRAMQVIPRQHLTDPRMSKFLGLQEAWVPLRKIHKDSRLRFLNAGEMLTPAFWDVAFMHSVAMKSAQPRLFITHPDAYLQDNEAYETGWTWHKIREMDRVYPDVTESQEVPEADAMEPWWERNEQLDETPGASASLNMRHGRTRVSMSPSIIRTGQDQPWRSVSPVAVRGPSPLLNGRRAPRPPHIRTASVPVVSGVYSSPVTSRRRVVSYGQSRRSSPIVRASSQVGVLKRRRSARSPSYPRHTPRWTSSPSPMLQNMSDRHVPRGTTPFAYATPHSNAPLQEVRAVRDPSVARSGPDNAPLHDYGIDELFDAQIYESESDASYQDDDDENDRDEESISSDEMVVTHIPRDSQHRQMPQDEPWPGIEDREHASDGENVDPAHSGPPDRRSNASSQPSEYPSTNQIWPGEESEFQIHEDDE